MRRQNSAVAAARRKTSRRRLCSGVAREASRPRQNDTTSENRPLVPTRMTASLSEVTWPREARSVWLAHLRIWADSA